MKIINPIGLIALLVAGLLSGCATPQQKLSNAIERDDTQQLESALLEGITLNDALLESIRGGREDFVKLLLSRGADPNSGDQAHDFDGPVLARATLANSTSNATITLEVEFARGDKDNSCKLIRLRRADGGEWHTNAPTDFLKACEKGWISFEYRVKLVNGPRAIHLAILREYPVIVELLLKAGADPNVVATMEDCGVTTPFMDKRDINRMTIQQAEISMGSMLRSSGGVITTTYPPVMAENASAITLAKSLMARNPHSTTNARVFDLVSQSVKNDCCFQTLPNLI